MCTLSTFKRIHRKDKIKQLTAILQKKKSETQRVGTVLKLDPHFIL